MAPDTKPAAETQPTVPMVPIEIDLPTGRPATIIVPLDMTDSEWLVMVGMIPKMRDKLRAQLAPQGPQLVRANELPKPPRELRRRPS